MKTTVISSRTPPSSVEMELSITRWTSSLGIKWANDHMARCASFIALPSSSISLMREATGEESGTASVWSLTASAVMIFKDRDIPLPNIQTTGIKAAPAMIARISPVNWSLRTPWTKSSSAASNNMLALYCSPTVNFAILNSSPALGRRGCFHRSWSRPCDVRKAAATTPELISLMFGNCVGDVMCHRFYNELCKIGVGYERARRVENQDDTVLPRPLRLDEIAEGVELEIGGNDARHFPSQGCANGDHRRADAKCKVRR